MATAKATIEINAKDNTKSTFKSISNELKDLKEDSSGLAKALGGFAVAGVAAVGAFAVSAIRGFADAEASATRVDGILNTMGSTALKNRDALNAAANAAVKLGFDDETAAESIAKFYQRTNDFTQALSLNQTAMDLARYKNISLEEASSALGSALSGNVRVLKEFGIAADETKTPLENIAMLQSIVAGQSASFATTFQGQMAIINETWSNFKDNIGGALVEALMPFVKQFNAWLLNPETKKQFEEWTATFKSWADVIIPTIVETFRLWAGAIKNVLEFLTKVGEKITEIAKPVANFFSSLNSSAKSSYDTRALTGRASGGTVASGSTYLVGESGPELFTAPSTGRIVPNSRFATGGGNIVINITGTFGVNQDVAEQIGDMIIQNFKKLARI